MWCAAAILSLSGCASQIVTVSAPQSMNGAEEYWQLTGESAAAVLGSLRWLELVCAQPHRCPAGIAAGFAEEVEHLQVDSLRIRARAQAIRARADAYFEVWSGDTNITNQTPNRPELAKMRQIRESCGRIKLASNDAGEAFRPFMSVLRKLQVELEIDPTVIDTEDGRALIRATREQGWDVLKKLGVLREQLQALRPILQRKSS